MTTAQLSADALAAIDRASQLHPFTPARAYTSGDFASRIITGGKGIRIRDHAGKELIDAFAGLYCVNVGYGRSEIAEAISAQAHQLAYYHAYAGHSSVPAITLAERILKWAPDGMRRVFFGLSGSDANETQVKLVWYYNNLLDRPAKKKIISRQRGYHGASVMSGSLTGLPSYHVAFDLPLPGVLHTTAPHAYWAAQPAMSEAEFSLRCAEDLERMIISEGPDTVAAFIAEPVLGTGGLVPPPQGYWEAIQPVLKRHDVLLIADEVICGFGRIGTPFGCHRYGIQPDLITIAKGLTSGYLPLSAAIVGDKVWRVIENGSERLGAFAHGYTYSAHPLCAAAANANLDIVESEGLVANAERSGAVLQAALKERLGGHPHVGEVRGVGLLAAVEFVADCERRVRFEAAEKIG
ncbi:MAG TPA: aminotransferase, partial [Rubrivivax sp.]|nr:aminotransferase [Rubrivivax sp.]